MPKLMEIDVVVDNEIGIVGDGDIAFVKVPRSLKKALNGIWYSFRRSGKTLPGFVWRISTIEGGCLDSDCLEEDEEEWYEEDSDDEMEG